MMYCIDISMQKTLIFTLGMLLVSCHKSEPKYHGWLHRNPYSSCLLQQTWAQSRTGDISTDSTHNLYILNLPKANTQAWKQITVQYYTKKYMQQKFLMKTNFK